MALQYSKCELEDIATKLQCCAAEMANESLTGEIFFDGEKKICGWNKFNFLQRTSKILSEYIPGGIYTYKNPFEVENIIVPDLNSTYTFRGATVINDILSPYYGFAFVVFQNLTDGNTYIYIIYNGELHSIIDSSLYGGGYMTYINSVSYDNFNDILVLGGVDKIEEYDLSPILLDPIGIPVATSNIFTGGTNNRYSAYNRINKHVYFSNSAGAEVKKFYSPSNTVTNIPVSGTPTHIAVNDSTGEIWVACGSVINVIDPTFNIVTLTIDLNIQFGASGISKITYNDQLNLFLVPYNVGLQSKVALLNPSGTVYAGSIYTSTSPVNQALYYQQDNEYFVGTDVNVELLINPASFTNLEYVFTLLNDTLNNKVIACSNRGDDIIAFPLQITIFSSSEEQEPLCLNDDDVQGLIELAQHYCCDCCATPVVQIDSSGLTESPLSNVSGNPDPLVLYTIYYGKNTQDSVGKADPTQITTLNSVNRYQFTGIYNYPVSTPAYIYFALPAIMGAPAGFLNAVDNTPIAMNMPYTLFYNGVAYRVYRSTNTFVTNISVKVI